MTDDFAGDLGLLKSYSVEVGEERDEGGERKLKTGQVTIDLDFAYGVEYDVDFNDEDGTLIVQYWSEVKDGVRDGDLQQGIENAIDEIDGDRV